MSKPEPVRFGQDSLGRYVSFPPFLPKERIALYPYPFWDFPGFLLWKPVGRMMLGLWWISKHRSWHWEDSSAKLEQ